MAHGTSIAMRVLPLLCVLLLSSVMANRSATAAPPEVENLGLAAGFLRPTVRLSDTTFVFGVSEVIQSADLNGDGDSTDHQVLHLYDSQAHETTNLGLAMNGPEPAVEGELLVFFVGEFSQGQDLNADSDLDDLVVHVYDTKSGILTNLGISHDGLSRSSYASSDTMVAFRVPEDDAGADLNNDGDVTDLVVHVYDHASGNIQNLGIAGTPRSATSAFVVVAVGESIQQADLNGDGDMADSVTHLYWRQSQAIENMGLASFVIDGFVSDRLIAVSANEFQEGRDLNGDGDTIDSSVLHIYSIADRSLLNLRLHEWEIAVEGGFVYFSVRESEQGGQDLNGDGDSLDFVAHGFDLDSGLLRNLQLDSRGGGVLTSEFLALSVREDGQGQTDLNSDGDASDRVLFILDLDDGSETNLQIALQDTESFPLVAVGSTVVFPASESGNGMTDLNGDADFSDDVVHVYDHQSSTVTNLGLSTLFPGVVASDVDADSLAFVVSESTQGVDLNGDMDLADAVVHLANLEALVPINLQMAVDQGANVTPSETVSLRGSTLLVVVSEADSGRDLNGDGDAFDGVLHVARLDLQTPCGQGSVGGRNEPLLRVGGRAGVVSVGLNDPVEVSLDSPTGGPMFAKYLLWVWPGFPASPFDFVPLGQSMGCIMNPTPLQFPEQPQPVVCVLGEGMPSEACGPTTPRFGPARTPWTIRRNRGFTDPVRFTMQAIVRSSTSPHPSGFGLTNAVVVQTH